MRSDIEQALSRPVCSGWDRGFLESILSQLDRGRQLSEKQLTTVTRVVLRNGEEAQAIHDEWESVFETEHKAEALVLANYYKTTGYFADLTRDILNGVVPDMRAYTKMRGNKYAQKVLDTYYSDARYDVGTLVVLRARCSTSNITYDSATNGALGYASSVAFKTKGGIILAVTDQIRSAAKGAKMYKILPIGASIPVFVEERYIKVKRK